MRVIGFVKRFGAVGAAVGAAVASGGAFAQSTGAIDATAVVSTVTAQLTPIGLVGAAVLGVVVAVKAFKWVRAALS